MTAPFYQDEAVTLYCGDAMEILPAIAFADAHVVIADPPYGSTKLSWDLLIAGWAALVRRRHLRRDGSLWCFGTMRMFLSKWAVDEFDKYTLAQDLVWEKHNGSSFVADRFKRVHESIVQFYSDSSTWEQIYKSPVTTPDATPRQVRRKRRPKHMGNIEQGHYTADDGGPRLMRSVIYARSCHGYAVHETQKPVELLYPLIEYSCPPGGLVLDPFAGSGSTLVAAKAMGRRAIGIEIDPKHCASAVDRLAQGVLPLTAAPGGAGGDYK